MRLALVVTATAIGVAGLLLLLVTFCSLALSLGPWWTRVMWTVCAISCGHRLVLLYRWYLRTMRTWVYKEPA